MTAPGWYPDGHGATRWFDGSVWTEHTALVGSLGAYALLGELGKGAFGTVYLATHPMSGEDVAVKVFAQATAAARADLGREVRALVSVRHGNCLQVVDVIDDGSTLGLVTDYVAGATLRAVLDAHGALTGPQALQVLWGAAHGLQAVHSAGLVHGDVKPANMLVQPDGVSKLIDFGLVGVSGLSSVDGSVSGSPAYAAPEQMAVGARTPQSDIYALSVTLYEVLANARPYQAGSVSAMTAAHANEPVPDLRVIKPEIKPLLAGLVRDGMAKDPAARPQNMTAFLRRFQDAAVEAYGAGWLTVGGLAAVAGGVAGAGLVSGVLTAGVVASSAAAGGAGVGAAAGGVAGAGSGAAAGATGSAAGAVSGGSATTTGILGTVGAKVTTAVIGAALVIGGGTVAAVTVLQHQSNPAVLQTTDPAAAIPPLTQAAISRALVPSVCGHKPGRFVPERSYGIASVPTANTDFGGTSGGDVILTKVAIGDLNGDGVADAAAIVSCNLGGVGWPDWIVIWRATATGPQVLGAYDTAILTNGVRGGAQSVSIRNGVVSVYAPRATSFAAGDCCPATEPFTITLKWTGQAIVAAGSLPPHPAIS